MIYYRRAMNCTLVQWWSGAGHPLSNFTALPMLLCLFKPMTAIMVPGI